MSYQVGSRPIHENNLYQERTLVDLLNEFLAVRISTIHLLSNMNKIMISKKGSQVVLRYLFVHYHTLL